MKNFLLLMAFLSVSMIASAKGPLQKVPQVICSGGTFGSFSKVDVAQGTALKNEDGDAYAGSFYSQIFGGLQVIASVALTEFSPSTDIVIRYQPDSTKSVIEANGRGWVRLNNGTSYVSCRAHYGE